MAWVEMLRGICPRAGMAGCVGLFVCGCLLRVLDPLHPRGVWGMDDEGAEWVSGGGKVKG